MPRGHRPRIRVFDMIEAAEKIVAYSAGYDFQGFISDPMRVDAVLRNLGVIGEAARALPKGLTDRCPDVAWAEIRGMRNVIAHEYFAISLPILWKTITLRMPEE